MDSNETKSLLTVLISLHYIQSAVGDDQTPLLLKWTYWGTGQNAEEPNLLHQVLHSQFGPGGKVLQRRKQSINEATPKWASLKMWFQHPPSFGMS